MRVPDPSDRNAVGVRMRQVEGSERVKTERDRVKGYAMKYMQEKTKEGAESECEGTMEQ